MTNPAYEATNSDVEKLIADMKAAAEKATPLQLDTAQLKRGNDGYLECPCCGGAGEVEDLNDFCNIDGEALGVQFYGIGEHHGLAEEYFRQVTPANVLALIAALEQAQQADGIAGMVEQYETALHIKDQRIAELEKWQQCEYSKKRNAVIDGLAQCGEAAWEIEEYMQQWDKEHPLELAAYKAELESAPNGMMQLSNELADMKRKCAELPDEFARIAENLRTQDNRITSHPVFVIFQKEEMVVSEEFDHDRIAWVWECGDGEVEDRTARRLEALHQGCRDTRGYSRYAMKSINRFVTACFTEDGCKDYLRQNGHNLNEPFIYVHSAYRNDEWQVIRNWLMTVGGTVAGGE